uniref:RNA-dependent RNA polymerase n=1 Tax=Bangxi Parti tick virus 1 TaxID=2972278 RepID=A0A9E7V275_9VIRU|nr:MAG: RNA-dependent RNA polymerase [Bangxi Parti tick virus 1]
MTKIDSDVVDSEAVSPWDKPFRHMTELGRYPIQRGIMRNTQTKDPFVKQALKSFDQDFYVKLKGWTRVPGDDFKLRAVLDKYDVAERIPEFWLSDKKMQRCYEQAVNECMRDFKLEEKVTPKFPTAVDLVMDSNSGFPHFERKSNIEETIRKEGRTWLHHAKTKDYTRVPMLPASLGTRGALSPEDDPKTRLVWMYPAAVTVAEGCYAQPLIAKMYTEKAHLFLTGTESRYRTTKFLSLISEDKEEYGVGLDFSSFDTFPVQFLIDDAFKILGQNISHGSYWDKTNGVMTAGIDDLRNFDRVKARSEHAFQVITDYFKHTPILLPNGRVVRKHIGVPSGSHFTNLIDSVVNRILQKTFALYTDRSIRDLVTNGDDSAFHVTSTHAKNLLADAEVFFRKWRMTCKPEKCVVAGTPADMHISGTRWKNLCPTRSTDEWFQMLLYPTTFVKDVNLSFQRLLGIGLAGGFHDASYSAFFEYFQTGYDCNHGPNLLSWKRLRWLEPVFGLNDLPRIYKKSSATTKMRTILWAA